MKNRETTVVVKCMFINETFPGDNSKISFLVILKCINNDNLDYLIQTDGGVSGIYKCLRTQRYLHK